MENISTTDYISREAAIKTAEFYLCDPDAVPHIIESLKSKPAADVRPVVRGKWVYDIEPDMFRCSVCNGFAPRNDYPFCHWCGADMRPPKEET